MLLELVLCGILAVIAALVAVRHYFNVCPDHARHIRVWGRALRDTGISRRSIAVIKIGMERADALAYSLETSMDICSIVYDDPRLYDILILWPCRPVHHNILRLHRVNKSAFPAAHAKVTKWCAQHAKSLAECRGYLRIIPGDMRRIIFAYCSIAKPYSSVIA